MAENRESIYDMWGKRDATYGEKGVCRRIKKKGVADGGSDLAHARLQMGNAERAK